MSRTPFEIPLIAANQAFATTVSGAEYGLKLKWNGAASCWMLDISDATGNPLVSGIPLITGADLLEQYRYLGIPGQLFVQTDNDTDAVPTQDNLGSLGRLYFVPFQ